MSTVYLTRAVRFSAGHQYYRPEWSEARNQEVFGACARPPGHGHNYTLEVMVAGEPHPDTGFSVDLAALDELLRVEVHERLDHRHLNHDIATFRDGGKIPTTENILIFLWDLLAPRIQDARLIRLRLREDIDLWADYYGPGTQSGLPEHKFV